MGTNTHRESATIFQFPVGGRAGLKAKRDDVTSSDYLASLGVCEAASGSSWYHQEAMEAERTRKN